MTATTSVIATPGTFCWALGGGSAGIGPAAPMVAGLLALGVDDAEKEKSSEAAASMPRQRKTAAASRRKARKTSASSAKRRPASSQSKRDLVIQMLRRQSGVTIEDITAKTGWQPHSVRGFFSGLVKKKLKLPLVSDMRKDGVRRYHIAPLASAKV